MANSNMQWYFYNFFGELFVADEYNNRIQVLDKNGSFIRKFGSYGTAPGQLKYPKDIVFLSMVHWW